MVAVSGLFVPLEELPAAIQAVGRALPLTYAVSLLDGVLRREPLLSHVGDVVALVVVFAVCTALSARIFRWE